MVPRLGEDDQAIPGSGVDNLHTHTILSHIFSMSPELFLILDCLSLTTCNSNIPESEKKNLRSEALLVPCTLDMGYFTCIQLRWRKGVWWSCLGFFFSTIQ
jgi:hypothetical protein